MTGNFALDFSGMVAHMLKMDEIRTDSTEPRRIGLLPVEGFALMSYASTVEPIRAANLLSGRKLYEIINISASDAPVPSSGAASVTPQAGSANA